MGTCKLCLQERKLVRAHIISNSMYRGIKDGNYVKYTKDSETGKSKTIPIQTGEFDKSILCGDCDNRILNSYEKYAKEMMFDGHKGVELKEGFLAKNIDYTKFKLFLLSVLWRSSITSRDSFEEVSLGNEQEEKLRKMIYEGDAAKETEYAIIAFIDMDKNAEKLIQKPLYLPSIQGLEGYAFGIGHVQYSIFIDSNETNIPNPFKKIMLKENGELGLLHLPKGTFIRNLRKRLKGMV